MKKKNLYMEDSLLCFSFKNKSIPIANIISINIWFRLDLYKGTMVGIYKEFCLVYLHLIVSSQCCIGYKIISNVLGFLTSSLI